MKNKTALRNKPKEYFTKGVKVTDEGVFWTNEKTLFSYLLTEKDELKIQASNKEYIDVDRTTLTEKDTSLLYALREIQRRKENDFVLEALEKAEKETDQILDNWSNLCSMKVI